MSDVVWEMIPFTSALDVMSDEGKRLKQRDYLEQGKIPVIDQGEAFIGGYTNDGGMSYKGELPVIIFGDHTRRIKLVNKPFAVGADGVKILKPKPFYRPKFLYYFLQSLEIPNRGYSRHFQFLRNFEFVKTTTEEQDRVLAEIEKQFSRLDEAAASLKRIQANLKRYKAAVLKAAVEGKLTEQWRKAHPDVEPADQLLKRILAERRAKWEESVGAKQGVSASPGFSDVGNNVGDCNKGEAGESFASPLPQMKAKGIKPKDDSWKKKYKEPAGPETANLPELPDGWVWARLEAIAALKGGITVDKKRKDPTARPVPYLRVANVQRAYLDLTEMKEIEASQSVIDELSLIPGDILFNEGGDRDKLGRGWIWEGQLPECIHQNHVFRARLYSSGVSAKLISWWGNSFGKDYFLRAGKQTTNLASINITKLSEFPIPLIPEAEQHQIVEEIDRRLSVTEELETTIETNLKRAERLRQTILQKAFSGGLV